MYGCVTITYKDGKKFKKITNADRCVFLYDVIKWINEQDPSTKFSYNDNMTILYETIEGENADSLKRRLMINFFNILQKEEEQAVMKRKYFIKKMLDLK